MAGESRRYSGEDFMKVIGMCFVNGATAWEFQAGRLVVKVLKVEFWCRRNAVVRLSWLQGGRL